MRPVGIILGILSVAAGALWLGSLTGYYAFTVAIGGYTISPWLGGLPLVIIGILVAVYA